MCGLPKLADDLEGAKTRVLAHATRRGARARAAGLLCQDDVVAGEVDGVEGRGAAADDGEKRRDGCLVGGGGEVYAEGVREWRVIVGESFVGVRGMLWVGLVADRLRLKEFDWASQAENFARCGDGRLQLLE